MRVGAWRNAPFYWRSLLCLFGFFTGVNGGAYGWMWSCVSPILAPFFAAGHYTIWQSCAPQKKLLNSGEELTTLLTFPFGWHVWLCALCSYYREDLIYTAGVARITLNFVNCVRARLFCCCCYVAGNSFS